MKKLLLILVALCFLLSGSVLAFAADDTGTETVLSDLETAADKGDEDIGEIGGGGDKDEEEEYQGDNGYEVENPNHDQQLGGKSKNAYKGLKRAAQRSRAVKESGSDSICSKANSHPMNAANNGNHKGAEKDKPGKKKGKKDKGNNGKKDK